MELKYNELRIGNLFDHMDDGILLIEEIKKDSDGFKGYYAVFRNGSIKCHVSYLQPIPLTEEWLLRFGFIRKYVSHTPYILNDISIYPTDANFYNIVYYKGVKIDDIILKSVSQLQNLYFSLTNNELKLIK